MSTDLELRTDQTSFDAKQLAALRQLGVEGASNADNAIFFHYCTRTGLDPFARQIYMIQREGKQTIQTGIDGFRLIARRAVDKAGETLRYDDTLWCGDDGVWSDVWLGDGPPRAAKVTIYRAGVAFPAVALYAEFVAMVRDKKTGERRPAAQWSTKPAHMVAKCAEAAALRKAFPHDLSGLYTDDEIVHDAPHRVRPNGREVITLTPDAEPEPEPEGASPEQAVHEPTAADAAASAGPEALRAEAITAPRGA